MAKYVLSYKAVDDLSAIWNYTYEVWSDAQADKYYGLLIDAIRAIAENPTIGKSYPSISSTL